MTQAQIEQILRTHSYSHDDYGNIVLTPVRITKAAAAIWETMEKEKHLNGTLPAHACRCQQCSGKCCLEPDQQ